MSMRRLVERVPVVGGLVRWVRRRLLGRRRRFPGTAAYWEERYSAGGDSGAGSYAQLAAHKAEVLNGFVARHGVRSVLELGCGDGNQLRLAEYPRYLGFDVSRTAIERCRELFRGDPGKSFGLMDEYAGEKADLALSLDVIYHLVEDHTFEDYMRTLFEAADRFVIVYASDTDDNRGFEGTHVRHRKFTRWIGEHRPDWQLIEHLPNRYPYRPEDGSGSFAHFFMFERRARHAPPPA